MLVYILEGGGNRWTQSGKVQQHKAGQTTLESLQVLQNLISSWMVTDRLHSYAALSWLQNIYLAQGIILGTDHMPVSEY